MKIYFKNVFYCIKKTPFQYVLLFLVLIITSAILIISFSIRDFLLQRELQIQKDKVGISDIVIQNGDNNELLFFFSDIYKNAVGDRGEVYSYLSLPMRINLDIFVDATAIPLKDCLQTNPIKLLESEPISSIETESSVIICQSLAEELHLHIGDTITCSFIGEPIEYTVKGIALDKDGFFRNCKIIVPREKVVNRILSEYNLYFLMDTDICSKVYINLYDHNDLDAVCDDLAPILGDSLSITTRKLENAEIHHLNIADIIVYLFCILTIITAILLCVSIFETMVAERRKSISLFRSIGASASLIQKCLLLEGCIYAVCGYCLSIGIAIGVLAVISKTFGMVISASLLKTSPIITIFIEILICFFSLLPTVSKVKKWEISVKEKDEKDIYNKKVTIWLIVIGILSLVGCLVSYLYVPIQYYYIVSISCVGIVFLIMYCLTPYAIGLLSHIVIAITERMSVLSFPILGIKTINRSKQMLSLSRVFSIGLLVLCIITSILNATQKHINQIENIVSADYIMMVVDGKTTKKSEDIQKMVGVTDTAECYFNYGGLENYYGGNCFSIKGKLSDYLSLEGTGFEEKGELQGDEIIITKSMAKIYNVKVDDKIELWINEQPKEYTITQIIEIVLPMVFFNAEYTGIAYDKILINCNQEQKEEVFLALQRNAGNDYSFIVDNTYEMNLDVGKLTVKFGHIFIIIIVVLLLVSILHDIIQWQKSQKAIFGTYYAIGANRKDRILYSTVQTIIAVAAVSVLAGIVYLSVSYFVEMAALSLGLGFSFF